jgi:hypothetical protein
MDLLYVAHPALLDRVNSFGIVLDKGKSQDLLKLVASDPGLITLTDEAMGYVEPKKALEDFLVSLAAIESLGATAQADEPFAGAYVHSDLPIVFADGSVHAARPTGKMATVLRVAF